MHYTTDDIRIEGLRPLIPPAILMEELPLPREGSRIVSKARQQIANCILGKDDRLIVVVGPCSIHEPKAGIEYARRLKRVADQWQRELIVVMRVYFEKPRTTIGWKGLINDPHLDGSFAINDGLRLARRFLLDVIALNLPAGTEFLDPISPQFLADLVSWGAIGARTTESQVHRELASGLSMPVGFKNGTGGSVQIAIDAIRSAAVSHRFLSVTKQGVAAIVTTKGNDHCHLILRGGSTGPNFSEEHLTGIAELLSHADLPRRVIVDCSHANSNKDHNRQIEVATNLAEQVSRGNQTIMGVMMESFLVDGRQEHRPGSALVHGQSITDACLSWERTEPIFGMLAKAVQKRRSA
ncbi:MAG: 3-deoxy-7-phosphoheptulonate synthase [Myxococcales bacterium]|nr:3-deoxy-7-phosphoheptulonate synthase [Myxococcales bacterium]